MQTFKYRAVAKDGRKVKGKIDAYDEFEAVNSIRKTYPVVEFIKPEKGRGLHIDLNEPLWVSNKTLALTAGRFAIMLQAGIPVARAVELIAVQCGDRLMRRYLTAASKDVAAGFSLADGLQRNGKKIPPVFIETVRAGEESGTIEQSFKSLETYYSRINKMQTKVRQALTYPAIVLALAIVVIAVIMTVLVPTMTETLLSFGSELPAVTKALIAVSGFFKNYWYAVLAALAAVIAGLTLYGRTERGKLNFSKLKIKMPVTGKIAKHNAAAQTANTLATLLDAGMSLTKALGIAARVSSLRCVGAELGGAIAKIENGMSLGEALADALYIPPMLVEMIAVGETSGNLSEALRTAGLYYYEEATAASDAAIAVLEPAITVVLGLIVAFVVIAIYVPMFSMSSGAGMAY